MLDWSYELLDPVTKPSSSGSGFSPEGSARPRGTRLPRQIPGPRPLLTSRSVSSPKRIWLRATSRRRSERLRLLETVRAYAGERPGRGGGLDGTASRHAMWLAGWAEDGAAEIRERGPAGLARRLEAEIANLRAPSPGAGRHAATRTSAFGWPPRSGGTGTCAACRVRPGTSSTRCSRRCPRRRARGCRADGAGRPGHLPGGCGRHRAERARSRPDRHSAWRPRGAACAAEPLTYVAFLRGDLPRRRMADRSLTWPSSRHPAGCLARRMAQGVVAFGGGQFERPRPRSNVPLDQARDRSDHWFIGECGSVLAHVHLARGDSEARVAEAESLAAPGGDEEPARHRGRPEGHRHRRRRDGDAARAACSSPERPGGGVHIADLAGALARRLRSRGGQARGNRSAPGSSNFRRSAGRWPRRKSSRSPCLPPRPCRCPTGPPAWRCGRAAGRSPRARARSVS